MAAMKVQGGKMVLAGGGSDKQSFQLAMNELRGLPAKILNAERIVSRSSDVSLRNLAAEINAAATALMKVQERMVALDYHRAYR